MSCDCGCCSGVHVATPVPEQNRPGLSRIKHRPGRYATFFETMQARLSSSAYPELAGLRTRATDDASIALCDAWAVSADVLTFYQDRIANEGYLRTATERRSVIELGRLTGYALRPGVSASVYLAYELDPKAGTVSIPIGTRAQSVPGTGEQMQTFETAEVLEARAAWSEIKARVDEPAWRSRDEGRKDYGVLARGLTFRGTATQLKANDVLLIDYGDRGDPVPYFVLSVATDNDAQTTSVTLRDFQGQQREIKKTERGRLGSLALVKAIETALKPQPRNALYVPRDATTTLKSGAEIYSRLLTKQSPALREMLIPALRTFDAARSVRDPIKVYAMRSKVGLFGSVAPTTVMTGTDEGGKPTFATLRLGIAWRDLPGLEVDESGDLSCIPLDGTYDAIKATDAQSPSYVVVDFGGLDFTDIVGSSLPPRVRKVVDNQTVSMSIGAAITSRVSQLTIEPKPFWLSLPIHADLDPLAVLRRTRVYAQSEELELQRDPLDARLASDAASDEIELDTYYDGLKPGMWVIAAGDRADIGDPDVEVPAAERAMIAAVRHDVVRLPQAATKTPGEIALPGDTLHTFVKLAQPLAYAYERKTFTLYGNVVRATHGETHKEPLGGGDATRTFQTFSLKSRPLTYVSAATPSGVASTLEVRVNRLLWRETLDLATAASDARIYATSRDDDETTTIRFGNGVHGARLPTGPDNVASTYRSGIGGPGNVRAEQITLATDKPLGVKGVSNPIRASGGADPDTLAQARVNAPLAVTALDRLVSVQDYADFACGFAGIGKAAAIMLRDGTKSVVHVTIAGIEDEPIDDTSDLYGNFVLALRKYGDPHMPVRVQTRRALLLVLQARVAIAPDYAWDDVQPRVRAALIDRFGFAARELGQPVFHSEILATIESVRGVDHVFGLSAVALDRSTLVDGIYPADPVVPGGNGDGAGAIAVAAPAPASETPQPQDWIDVASAAVSGVDTYVAAEIAYLPSDVPDNLILELAS